MHPYLPLKAFRHTVLLQSLIVQLIETGALSVEEAERAFDMALQRAKKQETVCLMQTASCSTCMTI